MIDLTDMRNRFEPDFLPPPGATLKETIAEIGLNQVNLARRLGITAKHVNEIIKGKKAITPEMALKLEKVLSVPASFWNSLECQYQEHRERGRVDREMEKHLDLLDRFPVREMIKAGWIEPAPPGVPLLQRLIRFFAVGETPQLRSCLAVPGVRFRKAPGFAGDAAAVAAWLRQGEIEAARVETEPWNKRGFEDFLLAARGLTRRPRLEFMPRLIDGAAACGVAVVLLPEIKGASLCGATRWLRPDKALVQLSLRYRTSDHFWFSLFHEAGHILLHSKKQLFLEVEKMEGEKERAADEFAARLLIPTRQFAAFAAADDFSRHAIETFAREIGIAPGIVLGRLQHQGLVPWKSSLNRDLKLRLDLESAVRLSRANGVPACS